MDNQKEPDVKVYRQGQGAEPGGGEGAAATREPGAVLGAAVGSEGADAKATAWGDAREPGSTKELGGVIGTVRATMQQSGPMPGPTPGAKPGPMPGAAPRTATQQPGAAGQPRSTAQRIGERLVCGYVWVNDSQKHFPGAPYGGFKDSGVGREESIEELYSYAQTKNVNINFG